MKRIIFLTACLVHTFCFGQIDSLLVKDEVQYVFSFSGLNLRSAATTDAHIISKLTHGTSVKVEAVSLSEEQLENRVSRWMKVDVDGQKGYLFGGFLSKYEPPHLDNLDYDCHDRDYASTWIEDRVRGYSVTYENYHVVNPEDHPEECREVTSTSFDNGEELKEVVRKMSKSMSLTSDQLSFNDVLNYMDYYAACREKWCSVREGYKRSIIVPVKDRDGSIKKLSCNFPHMMSVEKMGDKMLLQLSVSI